MTIDKQQLQKLLWAEAASFRADCADWKRNTEALDEFLGDKTVSEVALELLAENERVKARLCVCRDCGGRGEIYSGHSSYQGHNQPPEPDMDVCGTCDGDGVLGPLEDFEALAAERDQLKAENERLAEEYDKAWRHDLNDKNNVQALSGEVERLSAENEALRNALRPLLAHWDDLKAGESINVDAARAAMGKGEQS